MKYANWYTEKYAPNAHAEHMLITRQIVCPPVVDAINPC